MLYIASFACWNGLRVVGVLLPSFQRPSLRTSRCWCDLTSITSTPLSGTITTKSASPSTCLMWSAIASECRMIQPLV